MAIFEVKVKFYADAKDMEDVLGALKLDSRILHATDVKITEVDPGVEDHELSPPWAVKSSEGLN